MRTKTPCSIFVIALSKEQGKLNCEAYISENIVYSLFTYLKIKQQKYSM